MGVDLSLMSNATLTWAQDVDTADIPLSGVDDQGDPLTATLTGRTAAAYLFGQALKTVRYQDSVQPDGLQLSDGLFEFPPGEGTWVGLSELADALLYKYGVDPVIEFSPGLGFRGYSVADINAIIDLLNREYGDQFLEPSPGVQRLPPLDQVQTDGIIAATNAAYAITTAGDTLRTQSQAVLTPATESELRQYLTEGGDIYVNRDGSFYINGVWTNAMDLAVASRLLAQDYINAEYQILMREYADRNNETDAAWMILDGGLEELGVSTDAVELRYGITDALSELTAGQYTDRDFFYETDVQANTITFQTDPGWASLTTVRAGLTGGGLTAGTDYSLVNLGQGKYSFYLPNPGSMGFVQVDLTGDVFRSLTKVQDLQKINPSTHSSVPITATKGYSPYSNNVFDLMAHAYIDKDNGNKLVFTSIDPQWKNDQTLEFTTGDGGHSTGDDVNADPVGPFEYYITDGPNKEGAKDNVITAIPSGSLILYDGDSIPGEDEWYGDNQFSLANTNYATGTKFQVSSEVQLLLKHLHGGDEYFKSVKALATGTDYYLRNEGFGNYSVYRTADQAKNADEAGRLYFYIETQKYKNTAGGNYDQYIPHESEQTVTGISDVSILVDQYREFSFGTDPGWSEPTKVRVRESFGPLVVGVDYWINGFEGYGNRYKVYSSVLDAERGTPGVIGAGGIWLPYYDDPELKPDFYAVDDTIQDNSANLNYEGLTATLNTVISNNVRDGDLDQEKLQTLTAQLQNNLEAMTALIRFFSDLRSTLAQALR